MRLLRGVSPMLAAQLLLLALGLGVLGTLQYRWLGRVAESERQRIRDSLHLAAARLADGLVEEVRRAFETFLAPELDEVPTLHERWVENAPYPELVSAVYVADRHDGDTWTIGQLDFDTHQIEPTELPPALLPLQQALAGLPDRGPDARFPFPLFAGIPALFVVQLPDDSGNADFIDPRVRRVLFVQLDRDVIAKTILPPLVEREFGGTGSGQLDVALLAGNDVLYRSSPSWPDGRSPADVTLTVSPMHRGPDAGAPRAGYGPPREGDGRPREGDGPPPFRKGKGKGKGKKGRPPEGSAWRLLVRQGEGGLEAMVASTQRRNLAVSFGILSILGATVVTLLALLRRGERLRAQQARFVAVMSHELNTPLAALRVIGENLEQGIVQDREKLARYARTIVKESTRLSDTINQVLELSGMRARTSAPIRETVQVTAIVDEAIAQCRLINEGVDFEVDIESGLPAVSGRPEALTRAVQNLVGNAIRHGGGTWVGVRARREDEGVCITVEDRGPGIEHGDVAHLFEPFYRGQNSALIRGAGLGLTIVKEIVNDHGGTVEVDTRRRSGAAFSIHLPGVIHAG